MNTDTNSVELHSLFSGVACELPSENISISRVCLDSRKVAKDSLFIAQKGNALNGEDFIATAIDAGATAVAVDQQSFSKLSKIYVEKNDVIFIPVKNLKHAVSQIGANYYSQPSSQLRVIGVTGTNGKSTVVSLVAQLINAINKVSASIGTLGVDVRGDCIFNTGLTTPDALACQEILNELIKRNVEYVSMEVSSHAIDQGRINAIQFDVVALTNITRDHLDYHGTFDNYVNTKKQFLNAFTDAVLVINLDDENGKSYLDSRKVQSERTVITYSTANHNADIYAKNIEYKASGLAFELVVNAKRIHIATNLMGGFNLSNLLAAMAICTALKLPVEAIVSKLDSLVPVKGRMEQILLSTKRNHALPKVIVDFAHTPDALEKALLAVRQHLTGRLWLVFGCGGDRDRGKRPEMGRIASDLADQIVVTADNSRTESSKLIFDEIISGVDSHAKVVQIEDRSKAIEYAVLSASVGDSILVAGKGHEDFQILGETKFAYSDHEEVAGALSLRSNKEEIG